MQGNKQKSVTKRQLLKKIRELKLYQKTEISLGKKSPQNIYSNAEISKSKSTTKKDLFRKVRELETETIFYQLVEQWQQETRGISSSTELILNPAYQQIIGMGADVIPLLLRELERKSGRWFWALKAITRQDPVSIEIRGKTQAMINAWLQWGRENGYQW